MRYLREQRKLTQEELARKTNLNAFTIRRYEKGSRTPRADDLVNIAAALGCTLDELVRAEPPRKEA